MYLFRHILLSGPQFRLQDKILSHVILTVLRQVVELGVENKL
jgi:hypothetical protein